MPCSPSRSFSKIHTAAAAPSDHEGRYTSSTARDPSLDIWVAPKSADSMQVHKNQVNGVSERLVREDVEIFPALKVEHGPRPEEAKTVFRKLGAALPFEHFVEPLANLV